MAALDNLTLIVGILSIPLTIIVGILSVLVVVAIHYSGYRHKRTDFHIVLSVLAGANAVLCVFTLWHWFSLLSATKSWFMFLVDLARSVLLLLAGMERVYEQRTLGNFSGYAAVGVMFCAIYVPLFFLLTIFSFVTIAIGTFNLGLVFLFLIKFVVPLVGMLVLVSKIKANPRDDALLNTKYTWLVGLFAVFRVLPALLVLVFGFLGFDWLQVLVFLVQTLFFYLDCAGLVAVLANQDPDFVDIMMGCFGRRGQASEPVPNPA